MKKLFIYLNIAEHEISRVLFSWIVKFFLDTSHIIAHTMMLYYISVNFGVYKLPYFLLLEAFIIICVSLIYSKLNVKKELLLLILLLLNIFILILSYYFFNNVVYFLILFYIAYAVLTFRIMNIFNMVVEDLFTPLEASRTIPIIETSVLFGSLFGGLIVSFITYFHFEPQILLLIWAFLVLITTAIIYIYQKESNTVHFLLEEKTTVFGLSEIYSIFKNNLFIKKLSFFIILIFFVAKIMEFIYTVGINEIFHTDGHDNNHLLHGLGLYTVIFSFIGILVQIFFSQKWIHYVGIIKSMYIIPTFNIAAILSMFSGIKAYPNLISKFVFDVINTIYMDAYALIFYAFSENMRDNLKPFFDGVIRQIGMVLGTVLIIVIDLIFHENYGNIMHILAFILIFIYIYLFFVINDLSKKYTEMIKKNLRSSDLVMRFKAIENISQKGHEDNILILLKNLDMVQDLDIKKKILNILGNLKNPLSISYIIDYINHENEEIRLSALKAIYNIGLKENNLYKIGFTRYRLIELLKNLLNIEKNVYIKKVILDVFSILNYDDIIPFLLELLEKSDIEMKLNILNIFLKFDDLSVCSYVEKFLDSNDIKLKCASITVLYKFPENRMKLNHIINILISDINDYNVDVIVDMLSQLRIKQEENKLKNLYFKYKNDKDFISLAKKILISLIDLGNLDLLNEIPLLMSNMNFNQKKKFYFLIEQMKNNDVKDMTLKIYYHEIYRLIHHLLKEFKKSEKIEILEELIKLYELIGNHQEIIKLKKFMKE